MHQIGNTKKFNQTFPKHYCLGFGLSTTTPLKQIMNFQTTKTSIPRIAFTPFYAAHLCSFAPKGSYFVRCRAAIAVVVDIIEVLSQAGRHSRRFVFAQSAIAIFVPCIESLTQFFAPRFAKVTVLVGRELLIGLLALLRVAPFTQFPIACVRSPCRFGRQNQQRRTDCTAPILRAGGHVFS